MLIIIKLQRTNYTVLQTLKIGPVYPERGHWDRATGKPVSLKFRPFGTSEILFCHPLAILNRASRYAVAENSKHLDKVANRLRPAQSKYGSPRGSFLINIGRFQHA